MEAHSPKALLKNTFIISLGSVGAGVIKMLNVLLFTYFVSVDQVGDYDVAITYSSLLMPVACLAMYEAVYRWMLDDKASKPDAAKTSLVITVGMLSVFEIVAFFAMGVLVYSYRTEMLALIAAECIYSYSAFMARGMHDNKLYAIQGIVYAIVLIATNILLVVVLPWQARGLLWSVVAAGVASAVFVFSAKRYFSRYVVEGRFDRQLAVEMLKYSIPIMPNTTAWWLVSGSNRIIINWALGSAANGIFAVANRFPSILNVFTRFFYQAWQEQAISGYDQAGRDAYYTRIFKAYSVLLLSGVVLLLPISKLIIMLINTDFHEAYLYLGPLYLASAFSAMSAFYGTGYLSSKKTMGAFTTTIIGAAVNVAFTAATINLIGLYAAAFGSMLGNLAIWLARITQTKKYFAIKIDVRSFGVSLVACITMSLLLVIDSPYVLIGSTTIAVAYFIVANRVLFCAGLDAVKGKLHGKE